MTTLCDTGEHRMMYCDAGAWEMCERNLDLADDR